MNREHKEKAVSLLIQEGLSQNSSLKLLEYPKSTFYYKSKPPDTDTIDEIRRLAFRRKRDYIDEYTKRYVDQERL